MNASVMEEAALGQEEEEDGPTAMMVFVCRTGRLTVYLSRSTSPCSSSASTSSPASTSVSVSPVVVTLPRSSTLPRRVGATISSHRWFPGSGYSTSLQPRIC